MDFIEECPRIRGGLFKRGSTEWFFYLIGHFLLAAQGLLGHCTFVMQVMS